LINQVDYISFLSKEIFFASVYVDNILELTIRIDLSAILEYFGVMSGHNKWSKIKHKKGVEDAKKSKEFSKFARLITVEVKNAGGDANAPGVCQVIARAKAINMPNDNMARAITRGKEKDAVSLEEVIYEAYGPGGVALIIHGFTDNKNRAGAEIKHILSRFGSTLAAQGAASWAFKKEDDDWVAENTMDISEGDKEKLEKLTLELEENEDVQGVFTNASL